MKVSVFLTFSWIFFSFVQILINEAYGYEGFSNFGGGYGGGYGGISGYGHSALEVKPPSVPGYEHEGAVNYGNFCIGKTGLLAHPANCCAFINCDHGGVVELCSAGTLFNILTKSCDYRHSAKCLHGTSKYCAKKALKKHYPGLWG